MAKRYELARDRTIEFRGYPVTAKEGARVDLIKNASGTQSDLYAVKPRDCDAGEMGEAGKWSIFGHDSRIYYIWVDANDVREVAP